MARLRTYLSAALLLTTLIGMPAHAIGIATVHGHLAYPDLINGGTAPLSGVKLVFSSGSQQAELTTYTNSSGDYTAQVPNADDYDLSFEVHGSTGTPLPRWSSTHLTALALSGDTELSVTMPSAIGIDVHVTSDAGADIAGAQVMLTSGFYGSTSAPTISGSNVGATTSLGFSGTYSDSPLQYVTSASGHATIWTYAFPNALSALLRYTTPEGWGLVRDFTVNPTTPTKNVVLSLPQAHPVHTVISYSSGSGTVPLANAAVLVQSPSMLITRNYTTDANGVIDGMLPPANDYEFWIETHTAGTIPLPGNIFLQVTAVHITETATVGITLPAATAIPIKVSDTSGNALAGAKVCFYAGSSSGSSAVPALSGAATGATVSAFMFAGGWNDNCKVSLTNSDGVATLWAWSGPAKLDGYVRYTTPSGFTANAAFSVPSDASSPYAVSMDLPALVTVSGTLRFTKADGTFAPIANKHFSFDGGPGAIQQTVTTDANGQFSTQIPKGSNYSWTLEWLPGLKDPLPASLWVHLDKLAFSDDGALNVTLPRAHKISVHLTDALGQPITTGYATTGAGAHYGSSETMTISGNLGSEFTQNLSFSGGYNDVGLKAYPDANGIATLWSFAGPSTVDAQAVYLAPSGFHATKMVQFNPAFDQTIEATFSTVAVAESAGAVNGAIAAFAPEGATFSAFDLRPSTANEVPDGAFDVTGVLHYVVTGLTPGAAAAIRFELPGNIPATEVFKIINGQLVDIGGIASISGQTVTVIVTDGGTGDDDGLINGTIVDPILFVHVGLPPAGMGSSDTATETVTVSPIAMPGGIAETATTQESAAVSGADKTATKTPLIAARFAGTGMKRVLLLRRTSTSSPKTVSIWVRAPKRSAYRVLGLARLSGMNTHRGVLAVPIGSRVQVRASTRVLCSFTVTR